MNFKAIFFALFVSICISVFSVTASETSSSDNPPVNNKSGVSQVEELNSLNMQLLENASPKFASETSSYSGYCPGNVYCYMNPSICETFSCWCRCVPGNEPDSTCQDS